jgi:glycosyltransferase involved in cell wall biosynthesis
VKVLHVIPSISAVHGGPSTVLRTITKALVTRGVVVDVATTNDDGVGLLAFPLNSAVIIDGVKYRFFSRDIRLYKVSCALARWLDRHCSDYDLLHIHALFSFSSTAAARCAIRHRVPYILRPLGTLNRWGRHNRRPWLKNLSLMLVERRLLSEAAAVHFTSEQEKAEAIDVARLRHSIVLPNPVEIESPALALDFKRLRTLYPAIGNRKIILFLSRLDAKKGLDLLLEAFASLRKEGDDAVLVLAGEGERAFVARLNRSAEALGIADNVIWTGFLSGVEKYAAFKDASVFVLPSYSENFGVSVVEAMSQGLPVIVSDQVALHREIAEARAGLVVPCAVVELKQALRTLLADSELSAAASRNGKQLATQYSPSIIGDRLLAAYQQLTLEQSRVREPLAC